MESSILWQDNEQSIFLIDIPRSIVLAQGTTDRRHILSAPPLDRPYPSQEPKSIKTKANLAGDSRDADIHTSYQSTLKLALGEIRGRYSGPFCLPRLFTTDSQLIRRKRKLSEDGSFVQDTLAPVHHQTQAGCVPLPHDRLTSFVGKESNHDYTILADHESTFDGEGTYSLLGTSDCPTSIYISKNDNSNSQKYQFHVPPRASFVLGDCANSKAFRHVVQKGNQTAANNSRFNVVIMDPPWPNSSVKRTHKTPGSTYGTSESMWDMRELLLDTKIDLLMADDGFVGVWITNKHAVRELVLGEEGLFACWGVDLVEEWIWLKVTVGGEPVCPLDAVWRKPYEVLLWGRKRDKGSPSKDSNDATSVRRRTLMSVPDMHSRKPCLKELLHLLGQDSSIPRVLEVFARHLVSGWWSWGNECIKFNWDAYWREESTNELSDTH